jgi:holliday junction DNA helicase RuvA
MIAHLDGKIVDIDKSGILIISIGSLAFEVLTSGLASTQISDGDEIRVYTHLLIANERPVLYGFFSAFDRNLFKLLLTATQVGPRAALNILEIGGSAVARAISTSDARTLTAASGIGTKKAERIVLELRDKIASIAASAVSEEQYQPKSQKEDSVVREAQDALVTLGFTHQSAVRAVNSAIESTNEKLDTVDLIKIALRKIKGI